MKIVAKIGGSLLKGPVPENLTEDVKMLSASNEIALVHGGGDLVTDIANRLGKEQRFVISPEGIRSRYTDRETADIYTMVMTGLVAKKLVLALQRKGVRAVSISGLDGSLLKGKRKKKLVIIDERKRKVLIEGGYTGRVESVNFELADLLMSNGYVPVVSPVATSEDSEPLNIDGDRAASSLAVGIHAEALIFLTNVDGLILDDKLVTSMTPEEATRRLPQIGFGMQKKVMASVEGVNGGIKKAIICSGLTAEPLSNALANNGCTVIG